MDEELLSRHMMLLGGIGTGKTNAFYQIISQLRKGMTEQDIMIVFDTKGDFYQSFYQPGDVVISNDATACGPDGPDYWNIFNELELGEDMEVAINEISTTLFAQRLKNTTQPFFPNAAKAGNSTYCGASVEKIWTLSGQSRAAYRDLAV